ncbi:MAG: ABC transporter permease, partial [Zestosphaera sp.]
GPWIYSIRAMLIKIVKEDFVTAAVARGLPEKQVLRRYIIRPSISPILTNVLLGLAGTLGGYIITESVFDWPGMGTLYYAAITGGDAPTILALTYVFTLVYVVARFILEILYVALDPRVRL